VGWPARRHREHAERRPGVAAHPRARLGAQAMLDTAEANGRRLGEDLREAEALIAQREEALATARGRLDAAEGGLEQANRTVQEKLGKVWPGVPA
jgi:hypothetical protein